MLLKILSVCLAVVANIVIEDIQVGDLVYSYNTLTGETELREVTKTVSLQSNHINYLTIEDEFGVEQVVESTDVHPFWVVTDNPDLERAARELADGFYHENIEPGLNGFWVEAKDLRVGDVFLGANGELSLLTNAVRVDQFGGIAVFNFEVEGNHNYFILAKEYEYGQTAVLVHNTTNACDLQSTSKNAKELRANMEAAGKETGDFCHHIVPSTHQRAKEAREILERNNIPVNSAANGVGLTKPQHYGQKLHTDKSIKSVTEKIREAENMGGEGAIRETLQKIEVDILKGITP